MSEYMSPYKRFRKCSWWSLHQELLFLGEWARRRIHPAVCRIPMGLVVTMLMAGFSTNVFSEDHSTIQRSNPQADPLVIPPTSQRTLRVEIPFGNPHPYIDLQASTYLLHRPLVRWLEGGYECVLCREIPTLENGKAVVIGEGAERQLETTWQIHPIHTWANGDPIVAEDFVLAWNLIDAGFVPKEGVYRAIRHVKKGKSDHEIKITYWGTPSFYSELTQFFPLPTRMESDAWHLSEDYRKDSFYVKAPKSEALYSGDFIYKDSGRYQSRKIRELHMESAPSSEHFDVSQELSYYSFIQKQKSKPHRASQVVSAYASSDFRSVVLNLRHPHLANRKIRRALVLLLDREKILQELYYSGQTLAEHPFRYVKAGQPLGFNPKGGAKLLHELGFSKRNGVWSKDQMSLEFEVVFPSSDLDRKDLAARMSAAWKEHGILVKPLGVADNVFENQVLGRGSFPAMALVNVEAPRLSRSLFHSSAVPEITNQYTGQNLSGWQSVEVDKWIETYEQTLAKKDSDRILTQFVQLYQAELPSIPLHYLQKVIVHDSSLKSVLPYSPHFTAFSDQWLVPR